MRTATITVGGQLSIPADVRRRWAARRAIIEDQADALVLRPLPADPIGAATGSLAGPGPTTDDVLATSDPHLLDTAATEGCWVRALPDSRGAKHPVAALRTCRGRNPDRLVRNWARNAGPR